MVSISLTYEGDLHCEATHEPSGSKIGTDAPKDNEGLGRTFSPTDLVASGLAACMMTVIGIVAKRRELDLTGARCQVEKHMVADPDRRIGRLPVRFEMPAGIGDEDRAALERAAMACPVKRSLDPRIEVPVTWTWA